MTFEDWTRRAGKLVATMLTRLGNPAPGTEYVCNGSSSVQRSATEDLGGSAARLRAYFPALAGWSLRARIIAIVLAVALPANLVIAAVVWNLAGAAREAQRTSLLYNARSVAAALDAELNKYIVLALALSRSPAILSGDLTAFEQEARRTFAAVPDAWVIVADLDGQQLLNTASTTQRALPKRLPAAMVHQRQAIALNAPVVSGMRIGPLTRRWSTVIDVPVLQDERPYRVLVVTMPTDGFLRLFNAPDLPKNWLAGIIDEEGRYIARVPDHDRVVGELASEGWRRTAGRAGLFEFLSREGDPIVNANEVSSIADWTVGIGIKKSELDAAAWHAARWAAMVGAMFSILSLLLASELARRANRHLSELRINARELVAGRPATLDAPKMPELADVWNALKSAAEDRNRTDQSLRRSFETYFRLIKNAAFGVYLVDGEFRLAEVSLGAKKIFQNVEPLIGRDFGEVMGSIWPKPFADKVIAIFKHTLATGEPFHSANMSEVRNDTGEREAYDWRVERVALPDGGYGAVCYFYDLSERLRHEQHVRYLMNELNHRSKNMIGLVQAIARSTKAGSVEDFVSRFNDRLRALAANQDILVKTEWRGADLKELASAHLGIFADNLGGRIEIDGQSLMLNAAAAQALGMALHELATNAVKYGALSNDRGQVRVAWEAADGRLTCTWKEEGGPPVDPPTRHGFGTTVIEQMVRMSVNGTVRLEFAPGGLAWRLDCPLDAVSPK